MTDTLGKMKAILKIDGCPFELKENVTEFEVK